MGIIWVPGHCCVNKITGVVAKDSSISPILPVPLANIHTIYVCKRELSKRQPFIHRLAWFYFVFISCRVNHWFLSQWIGVSSSSAYLEGIHLMERSNAIIVCSNYNNDTQYHIIGVLTAAALASTTWQAAFPNLFTALKINGCHKLLYNGSWNSHPEACILDAISWHNPQWKCRFLPMCDLSIFFSKGRRVSALYTGEVLLF